MIFRKLIKVHFSTQIKWIYMCKLNTTSMTNLCAYSYPAPLMRTNIIFCLISNLNKFFLFYRINYLLSDPLPDDPNDNGYTTLISIISSIHYLKRNHSATSILHNYFPIDRRGKSINHLSVFSSTVSGTTIHHLNQGCGSAFNFFRIRIQRFFWLQIRIQLLKNEDPDPA